ncbi:unnamed protein product [Clavelina lepadiformis]|uniref:RNA helicase n=1 Tax=Clavelina lepadiformis TaxID=159417 RepID=A0ABP0GEI6_CLALP
MDTFGAGLVHDWSLEDEEIVTSTSPHPDNEDFDSLEKHFIPYDGKSTGFGRQEQSDFHEIDYLPSSDEESSSQVVEAHANALLGDLIVGEDDELSTAESIELNPFDGLPYSSMYYELLKKRQSLPIWKAKDDFVLAVDDSPIVLITGRAGSGKSTQVPQWCVQFARESNFGFGTVVCAQPHAQVAMSLAIQVAREMDLTEVGNEVGYKIPQRNCTNQDTVLQFCTDDVLLREMADDPLLHKYNFVVIDEVQERSISIDILLALFKVIQNSRDDLRIIIISQSYEMPKLEDFFEEVPIVDLHFLEEQITDGSENLKEEHRRAKAEAERLNKLEINYRPVETGSHVQEVVSLAVRLHCDPSTEGDFLVYLPTTEDIEEACEQITRDVAIESLRDGCEEVSVIAIHKKLVHGAQQAIYENTEKVDEESKKRRIIVSDEITESSFSTDYIRVVIDSGLKEEEVYNCRTRTRSKNLTWISCDSALARTDRCNIGGKIYRIYSEDVFTRMKDSTTPCIRRMELTTHVLLLKRLLQRLNMNFSHCHFIEPPAPEAYMLALEELDYHGALDENGNLSDLGAVMSEFPLTMPQTKAVIASCGEDCVQEVLSIIAMIVSPSWRLNPRGFEKEARGLHKALAHKCGGHFTLLNVYQQYINHKRSESWCSKNYVNVNALKQAEKVRIDLLSVLEGLELPISEAVQDADILETSVKRALLAGFFMQVARDVDGCGNFLIIRDKHVARLDPTSLVDTKSDWVLYDEFLLSENSCISTVCGVRPFWIAEISPQSYLANLPQHEGKDYLLKLAARWRKQAARQAAEPDADLNLHSQRRVQSTPKSLTTTHSEADQVGSHNSNAHPKSFQIERTKRTGGETSSEDPKSNDDVDDSDVLTQAARDMAFVYRKASDYVTNREAGADAQCIVQ